MQLSEELTWRGFVNQTTFQDITQLDQEPIAFYFGVDPSASSMQVGNLAAAMLVRHFIDHGHKAYLLVGGATGLIGDPDGKKDERNLKSVEEIGENKQAIAKQYKNIFSGKEFTVVDNNDWFKDIRYIDFLREIGKHVPMSSILGRDFVQARLGENGSGISYAEFSYSLMQGYDYLHLFRTQGVTLQLCGADQWGNSIAGVDMIRRIESAETHVLSMPLILNKSTGKKFGKSEEGAVWLDPSLTSVYKFYQFWLNVDDEGVSDYLKIYTMLPREEIEKIVDAHSQNQSERTAQKRLALEVTNLVHGIERTERVRKVTEVLFGNARFQELNPEELDILAQEIPTLSTGVSVIEALVSTASAGSNGEARRLIEAGAISINDEKITSDAKLDFPCLIKKSKNSFIFVR